MLVLIYHGIPLIGIVVNTIYVILHFNYLYSYLVVNQLKGVTMDKYKQMLADGKITREEYDTLKAAYFRKQRAIEEEDRNEAWDKRLRDAPLKEKKKMAREAAANATILSAKQEDWQDRKDLSNLGRRMSFAARGGAIDGVF